MTPGGICFPEGKARLRPARRGREGTRRAAAEAQPKRRTRAQRGLRSRPSPCRPSRSAGSKPPLLFSFLHHAWTLDSPRQLLASLDLVTGWGGWRRCRRSGARQMPGEFPSSWACHWQSGRRPGSSLHRRPRLSSVSASDPTTSRAARMLPGGSPGEFLGSGCATSKSGRRPGFVAAPAAPVRRPRQRPYHASRRAVDRFEQRGGNARVDWLREAGCWSWLRVLTQ